MNTDIKQLLQEGVILITPTNRLSRHLQSQYTAFQISQGAIAWRTPDILPWSAWLRRCWENISMQQDDRLLLLNAYQQQALWQQLISGSPYAQQLLQSTTTAKQAIDAWNLLQQWQITEFPDDIYLNEDARVFNSWASAYQKKCEAENWFDESSLASIYAEKLHQQARLSKESIALVGFTDFTPQQKSLFTRLKQAGCVIREIGQDKRAGTIRQGRFLDSRQEIRAAANWARQLLDEGEAGSIGLVVPNLQRCRNMIEAEFDDALLPAAILSAADSEQRPYSISLGRSLSDYPLIDAALTLLNLLRPKRAITDISLILRTPFLKGAELEQHKRARLDAALREHGETSLSLNTILYVATNKVDKIQSSPILIDCLLGLREFIEGFAIQTKSESLGGSVF